MAKKGKCPSEGLHGFGSHLVMPPRHLLLHLLLRAKDDLSAPAASDLKTRDNLIALKLKNHRFSSVSQLRIHAAALTKRDE